MLATSDLTSQCKLQLLIFNYFVIIVRADI